MKRPTWILLVILLVLVGLLIYLNREHNLDTVAESTPVDQVEFLFSDTDGLPTGISISANQGDTVTIKRAEDGSWVLVEPLATEADQGSAEAAASQATSIRVLSRPEVPLDAVGLLPASYSLRLDFTSSVEKEVRIGDLTPTNTGYYASMDGEGGTLILDKAGVEALLALLQSPPYLHTPTPSATASQTPQMPQVESTTEPAMDASETPQP